MGAEICGRPHCDCSVIYRDGFKVERYPQALHLFIVPSL